MQEKLIPIDPNRLYFAGFSYGGKACWEFLKAAPDLFAAAMCHGRLGHWTGLQRPRCQDAGGFGL